MAYEERLICSIVAPIRFSSFFFYFSKRKLLLQHAGASCGNMLFQLLPQHVKFVELVHIYFNTSFVRSCTFRLFSLLLLLLFPACCCQTTTTATQATRAAAERRTATTDDAGDACQPCCPRPNTCCTAFCPSNLLRLSLSLSLLEVFSLLLLSCAAQNF